MKFASKLMIAGGLIVVLVVLWAIFFANPSSNYDSFAQCLTSKGMKMYGAFWCPHCQDQKQILGSSMKYINYIECSTPDGNSQTPECSLAGIQSYPTWQLPDGIKRPGELSLQELSIYSNCSLPSS